MVSVGLSAASATHVRLAVSCLWEVLASVRILRDLGVPAVHRRWADRARPALAANGLLAALVAPSGGYTPDFLTPPPPGVAADLSRELDGLRATPPAVVRAELDLLPALSPALRALRHDPGSALTRLATEIENYWSVAIAPDWPRMRALLDAEVQRQARRLAEDGTAHVLNDLHERVTWTGGTLHIDQPHCPAPDVPEGAAGLILIPSVFVWPSVLSVTTGETPQLAYPARGVATLWEQSAQGPDALSAVLGRGRARLLAEMATPLSTTELARRTGITAGGVSQHLTTLRAAGLVVTHRRGRALLNARTAVADALVAASHSGSTTAVG
nr:helix-turn-helix domain-containing protein [uncultured Actinoplanes sp.]